MGTLREGLHGYLPRDGCHSTTPLIQVLLDRYQVILILLYYHILYIRWYHIMTLVPVMDNLIKDTCQDTLYTCRQIKMPVPYFTEYLIIIIQ